ncbi:hypothetical protein CBR_g1049 [Chara braunii]|uniref:NAD-dependent epimerase/dehydratase domain-containing protein n=1 Tax=Chara braunii TaxID=69332 RepID=A0A388KCZ4_CHABU|nr:hypothetical protein CBR_g1049 [Chara braunii]|eukprot:GBG67930.1 hypothetical protein CBR_g1049 [Chara braunii]
MLCSVAPLCYAVLYRAMSCYVMLCSSIVLCRAISCYVVLCRAISCYIMLCPGLCTVPCLLHNALWDAVRCAAAGHRYGSEKQFQVFTAKRGSTVLLWHQILPNSTLCDGRTNFANRSLHYICHRSASSPRSGSGCTAVATNHTSLRRAVAITKVVGERSSATKELEGMPTCMVLEEEEEMEDKGAAAKESHDRRTMMQDEGSNHNHHLFCFGMGYTCRGLSNLLVKKKGWRVSGTCRDEKQRQALELQGFNSFLFSASHDSADSSCRTNKLSEEGISALLSATHLLISIPPALSRGLDPDLVLQMHAEDVACAAGQGRLRWIGYLSTTGVYGDRHGEWVDEEDDVKPGGDAKVVARVCAERAWSKLGESIGCPVHIFRLGGIYGPGRSLAESVSSHGKNLNFSEVGSSGKQRRQMIRRTKRFVSRCHVADICHVLVRSMAMHEKHHSPCVPPGTQIYNVVDDSPASRDEVMAYTRLLLARVSASASTGNNLSSSDSMPDSLVMERGSAAGSGERLCEEVDADGGRGNGQKNDTADADARPPYMPIAADQMEAQTSHESTVAEKRVRNTKIKRELGVRLLHPDYRSGMWSIVSGDNYPFD